LTRRQAATLALLAAVGVVILVLANVHKKQPIRNATHSVTLKWAPSEGASSYNIYRSTTSGVRGDKIGTSAVPTYLDKPVPSGATLYYTVTAVENGKESGPSTELKIVVP
jgi:fibronectin type 3 domain-containing protein